jgi:dihydroxy-acid dehydratase
MAAVSADLPTVVIPVGPMVVGHHKGEVLGACTDCRRLWANTAPVKSTMQRSSRQRPARAVGRHLHGDGHGLYHGLHHRGAGLSLPMSATIPAPHAERFRLPKPAAKVAAAMAVAKGTAPERIADQGSFRKAQSCCRRSADRPTGLFI